MKAADEVREAISTSNIKLIAAITAATISWMTVGSVPWAGVHALYGWTFVLYWALTFDGSPPWRL